MCKYLLEGKKLLEKRQFICKCGGTSFHNIYERDFPEIIVCKSCEMKFIFNWVKDAFTEETDSEFNIVDEEERKDVTS